jgi:hypothetical protein
METILLKVRPQVGCGRRGGCDSMVHRFIVTETVGVDDFVGGAVWLYGGRGASEEMEDHSF